MVLIRVARHKYCHSATAPPPAPRSPAGSIWCQHRSCYRSSPTLDSRIMVAQWSRHSAAYLKLIQPLCQSKETACLAFHCAGIATSAIISGSHGRRHTPARLLPYTQVVKKSAPLGVNTHELGSFKFPKLLLGDLSHTLTSRAINSDPENVTFLWLLTSL